MKLNLSLLAAIGSLAGIALVGNQAKASLVYDNGAINGTIDAFTLNFGYIITNSFTVSSNTTLSGAQFGAPLPTSRKLSCRSACPKWS